MKMKWHYRK